MITNFQSSTSQLISTGCNPENVESGNAYDALARSRQSFANHELKEGLKWYFVGLIRTRQDAVCCTDSSVISALDNIKFQFSSEVFEPNKSLLTKNMRKKALRQAVKWVEDKEILPDPSWIVPFGMSSWVSKFGGKSQENSLHPIEEWPRLRKEVIDKYKEIV
jgi:hypothetical protein